MNGMLELVQHVGEPIDGDRLQARIAEDDFVERLAGRVAVVGGLHVGGQHAAQLGQLLEEQHRLGLAEGFVVLVGLAIVRERRLRAAGRGRSAW